MRFIACALFRCFYSRQTYARASQSDLYNANQNHLGTAYVGLSEVRKRESATSCFKDISFGDILTTHFAPLSTQVAFMTQPAPHIALVRAAFSQPFQMTLNRMGSAWKADLEKLGIPADYVVSPLTLIPERPWHRLVDQIALRESIPDLGLQIGNEIPFGDISSMSFLLRSCSNLQELLSTFCLQAPQQSSSRRFDIVHGPTSAWLRDTGASLLGDRQSDIQIRLYILLGMVQVVQLALGKSWRPRTIELPFKYSRAIEQSAYLGAESIYFDREFSAIEIPLEALSAQVNLKPGWRRLDIQAEEIQKIGIVPVEFHYSVRQAISSCLTANDCHIDNIALLCGVSVRTLQRIFSVTGVSYTDLLEQTRREKSRQLVQQDEMPLDVVAHNLGYSDYSKFSRAFQRWFGETPRQARLRCRRRSCVNPVHCNGS